VNHLGDINKMVDTPRMDSAAGHARGIVDAAILAEGIKLERELNAANERIKRLEEALAAYQQAYTPDGHTKPHDCFATGPRTGDPIQDLVVCPGCWAEQKAKEAKP
jgi:hypothetical protein